MYEYISGPVAEVAPAYAVIDAGGVGYYLHISLETFSAIEHTETARLYVHYVVREDAQLLLAAIDGAKGLYGAQDEELLGIVNEEAGRFFAGDCTAEQCAAVIQDRVSIYINERR